MEATKRVQQEEFCGLVLTYRVNDTLLCVPVEHVESVIEPPALTEIPHAPDYVLGAFLHRGKTALALSLRKLLRLPPAEKKSHKETLLVIWMGDQPIGYWVDEIKGMTDSGRGHWSAVPALIRDQGITRALICDGQVYFPLDLTHSKQFRELTRTLDSLEKIKLQSASQTAQETVEIVPAANDLPSAPTALLEEASGAIENASLVQPQIDETPDEAVSLIDDEQQADLNDAVAVETDAWLADAQTPQPDAEHIHQITTDESPMPLAEDDDAVVDIPADDILQDEDGHIEHESLIDEMPDETVALIDDEQQADEQAELTEAGAVETEAWLADAQTNQPDAEHIHQINTDESLMPLAEDDDAVVGIQAYDNLQNEDGHIGHESLIDEMPDETVALIDDEQQADEQAELTEAGAVETEAWLADAQTNQPDAEHIHQITTDESPMPLAEDDDAAVDIPADDILQDEDGHIGHESLIDEMPDETVALIDDEQQADLNEAGAVEVDAWLADEETSQPDAESVQQVTSNESLAPVLDTSALAWAMHAAARRPAGLVEQPPSPEVQFDSDGQGDAFLEQLAEADATHAALQVVEEPSNESIIAEAMAESQLDAFDENYQALLQQNALEQAAAKVACAELIDDLVVDEELLAPSQTIETVEPEAIEPGLFAWQRQDNFDTGQDAQQRQAEIDAAFSVDIESPDRSSDEQDTQDSLHHDIEPPAVAPVALTGEPIFLVGSVDDIDIPLMDPEYVSGLDVSQQAELRQAEINAAFAAEYESVDESIYDEPTLTDLSLTEEPYSFVPTSLPEDDELSVDIEEDEPAAELDAAPTGEDEIVDESIYDEPTLTDLSLTEEPYSFAPTSLPEDDELSVDVEEDEPAAELDNALTVEDEITDESIYDEPTLTDLSLTEEPYSFVQSSLPEDNELLVDIEEEEPVTELDAASTVENEIVDESILDEPVLDDHLTLTEEPYSFVPTSLPEDDELLVNIEEDEPVAELDVATTVDNEALDEPPTLDNLSITDVQYTSITITLPPNDISDEVALETNDAVTPGQALMVVPDTNDARSDEALIDTDASLQAFIPAVDDRPVIVLPQEQDGSLNPELTRLKAEADYYSRLMADKLPESMIDESLSKLIDDADLIDDLDLLQDELDEPPARPTPARVYKLKIPEKAPQPEVDITPPSMGEKHLVPRLDPGGFIIRPDGQINKSFSLVKLFTIILATSAAGAWWFRDELFYRELIRKEIPSILQNEIAFLYSNRVNMLSPEQGADRVIVDTPDFQIKVIRKDYVTAALLGERKKKGVKIHRVRKGETLGSIVERYLPNPHSYPELTENSWSHNPKLIRPGDVVKITNK